MDTTNTPLPVTLDATAPTLSAATFLEQRTRRLIHWRNDFHEWSRTHYEPRDKKEIRAEIYRFCDTAVTVNGTAFKPTIKKVDEIIAAIQVQTLVPDRFKPCSDIHSGEPMPGFMMSCQNGLLDISTGTLSAHSDQWLILNSLPFSYDPGLPEPFHWFRFLKSLWPGDDHREGGAIATLQEMLGYLVSGRTDMQKIFLLIGPPRSGKSTIAYVIENLIGAQNYVGIQFAQLTEPTGMQVLIGKTVMMIPDARPAYTPNLFIRERLVLDKDTALTKQQLYNDFRKWCADNGHQPCAENIFAQRIKMAIPDLKEYHRRGQPRCWLGVWVRREGDDGPSPLDRPAESLPTATNPDPRAAAIFV